jgi:hypothetical protein
VNKFFLFILNSEVLGKEAHTFNMISFLPNLERRFLTPIGVYESFLELWDVAASESPNAPLFALIV